MDQKFKVGDEVQALYLTDSWDKAVSTKIDSIGYVTQEEVAMLQRAGRNAQAGEIYYNCINEKSDSARVVSFFEESLRIK